MVDTGSEFYNRSIKLRLQNDYIEMYSTHNEGNTHNLLMQSQAPTLTLIKKIMKKILNLKLVIMLEYQSIKTFSLRLV